MVATFEQLRTNKPKTFEELRAKPEPPDYGMIALPRDKLPGVWDYNKQLDQLLGGDVPMEELLPLDVRYEFGRVVGMTEKPIETEGRMEMSLIYSIMLRESPAKTFNILDELNKIAFKKPIPVEKALKEYRDYYTGAKNYVGAIKHGLRRANVMAQKQIGGLAKMAGEFIEPQERVRPLFPALNEWEKRNSEILKKWSDMILADVEDYYSENKAEAIQILPGIGYWKTLEQYITKPVNLVQGIVESSPLMLEGILGMTIGGPAGGIAVMGVPITGDVYTDARAEGTEPLPAMVQAILTGTGEAAIEQWTLGKKLGLMRNYRKLVAGGLPKVLWEGTKAFFRGTAEEGSQEFNRNFWRWVFTDRSQQWTENIAESMAAGGPMEMVMAGAFSAAGMSGPVVPREQQYQRIDKIQEAIEAEPTLSEEHKVEIRNELDTVRKDIEADVYKVEEPEAEAKEIPAEIAALTDDELYEKFRATKITEPEWKPLYEEVVRRKEAETPPTAPKLAPEKPTKSITKQKGVEIAPEAKQPWEKSIEKLKQLRPTYKDTDIKTELVNAKGLDPAKMIDTLRQTDVVELGGKEIGTVGDFIIAPKAREQFSDVLDVPIFIDNTIANRAELHSRSSKTTHRAIAPKMIVLNPKALNKEAHIKSFAETFYHEVIHAQRALRQRAMEAEGLPHAEKPAEISAKKGESYWLAEGEKWAQEALKKLPEQVEPKPLRQKIHAIAAVKGLTKKALSELKKKHTGFRRLTGKVASKKITTEQLQNLLKAVQKTRPKRVGYKEVITRKTEKKIQSLKENLIKKTQMTKGHFKDILEKEVHGKEPKYTDAKNFITETQGKEILRRMLDAAEIVRLTESFEQAIAENPEIADQVKLLDSRIEKSPKRDPYSLESMRYYNQQAQIKTGAPIFTSYMDLIDTHLEITKTRTATWKRLQNTTEKFKDIAKDEESLQRVSDYIASQSTLKEKPAMPKDITADEKKLAKEIQKILEEYRIKVRVAKFYNWYYYNQPIPDHDRYRKEITKAVDIYESKGREELIDYLNTQEWGVVKSGYEPLEILFHKVRPYTTGATSVGKGHVKIRTDIEYHRQERNILQRLSAYMRQIDMLYNLSPKINAYVRLYDDNASKFSEWGKVKNDIEIFLRNLKRYNIEGGFFERMIARAYSQAMRVIIMPSPVLSFRNLFQNAAFEHDKSILIDPRNTKLTSKDIEYLETYVLQTRAMVEEYFMVGEKPLHGLGFLTKIIDKIKIYPYSDIANRHWSFWAKTNQVDRALTAESTKQMMTEAKFEDMKELEQRRALGILARDGKEAMTQYVGRVHVDDIHFLYERAQRSPAEMTSLGKIVGNLMLFPRAYGEKLAHVVNKTLKGKTYEEQWRGLKTIFAVVGGGMIAGSIYMKITGRKRNPYNPLEILAFRPGGLAWGSVEAATEIYANILSAARGDSRALAALTVAIPRAADMFIPFYDYSLRAIEAATDQKNIDRKALRQMRMMIDKEYKIRGGAYKVKRNALEKWQYFISGPSAEREKTKKATPKKISR